MVTVIGCVICGHESKTERESEQHFNQRHKRDPKARECSTWVDFFHHYPVKKEAAHVGVC